MACSDPSLLKRQMCLLLLPRRDHCCSPNMSPQAFHLVLQNSPMPCGERREVQPQLSASLQRSQGTIWSNGVFYNGDVSDLASCLSGDVHWYAHLHAEYSGPVVQYHSRWPCSPSSVGALWCGLIIHSTTWCLPALLYTDLLVYPACFPWCFNGPPFYHNSV